MNGENKKDNSELIINELVIKKIWLVEFLQGRIMKTLSGKRIRVFSPGWWNYEKGPDFKNCEIELEGELISGDAEIHINSSDWYKHKHHEDSSYINTILHIIWIKDNQGNKIFDYEKKEIEEVLLSQYIPRKIIIEISKRNDCKERRSLCASYFNSMKEEKIYQLLEETALARLRTKCSKILKRAKEVGFEQILYENILRACGYKHTKYLLEELGMFLSIDLLKSIATKHQEDNLIYIQAALYGCADLLPSKEKVKYYSDEETSIYLNKLWEAYEKLAKEYNLMNKIPLPKHPSFSRPTNTPIRRLTAISYLIKNSSEFNIFQLLITSINNIGNFISVKNDEVKIKKLIKLWENMLTELKDSYWSRRFYFGFSSFKKPQKLIGKERARAIILNAFIPVLLAYSEYKDNIRINDLILKMFIQFPSLNKDSIIKLMEKRLNLKIKLKRYSLYQQGLHGIFELFCNNPFGSCRQCPLTLSFGN